jgi:hypothetical protein
LLQEEKRRRQSVSFNSNKDRTDPPFARRREGQTGCKQMTAAAITKARDVYI